MILSGDFVGHGRGSGEREIVKGEGEGEGEGEMDDYAREMMDLKTLVTRTLEKKGILAKIRVIPSPSHPPLLSLLLASNKIGAAFLGKLGFHVFFLSFSVSFTVRIRH